MTVYELTDVDATLCQEVNLLIPQLSSSAPFLSEAQLLAMVRQEGVYLFVYRPDLPSDSTQNAPILGMLTLATFTIPTGGRGWIEDVVVDQQARGQGAGKALVDAALAKARELSLATVDLTSRPFREAANRLYLRCGFEPRETNIYRYKV